METKWILEPFNGVYFATAGVFVLLFAALHILLRKKSRRFKGNVLSLLMLATTIGFIAYKYYLSMDADYSAICRAAGVSPFNWWHELPLQLCNINMLIIPLAIWDRNHHLQGFCFFSGTLGALMALVMPCTGFDSYSILLPRMLGYYGMHWMVFFGSLSLITMGIFKPKFRDIPGMLLIFFLICFIIYCVNMVLRITGLCPLANYWYNVSTEGNPLLDLFYSWIPCPFLYTLPAYLIMGFYMLLVTGIYRLVKPQKKATES